MFFSLMASLDAPSRPKLGHVCKQSAKLTPLTNSIEDGLHSKRKALRAKPMSRDLTVKFPRAAMPGCRREINQMEAALTY
jgi:hypothetical protein